MFSEIASGAASGAGTGAMIGGPYGALAGAVIGGGLGAMNSSSADASAAAARQAAARQVQGLRQGINAEKKSTKKAIGYLDPYMANYGANTLLNDALGVNGPDAQSRYFAGFQNDPGYISARDAGVGSIEASQAGPGMLHSGGTLKALQDYGQRLMWSQFQDRLKGLAGQEQAGLSASTTAGGYQTQLGQDKANLLGQIGTAKASGIVGAANAGAAGTQNMLDLAGYGIGAASKFKGNDLASYFGSSKPVAGDFGWSTTTTPLV
jgi:hypothetical protein